MKKNFWLVTLLFLSLFLLGVWASPAAADDGGPIRDDDVNKVASQLYCPICNNVPLDVCPSQACADWRGMIRKMLEEGKSEEEIKTYFATQYGWHVLSMPPRVGLNWLIYVLPVLITLGGIALVVKILRTSKHLKPDPHPLEPSAPSPALDKYLAHLNRDLNDEDESV